MPLRAFAIVLIVLAASVPYLPTIDNYFAQDDFGVVALLSQKPATYFPRWFVTTWMDDIWGYVPDEIRPFPAVTYQAAALWGAASPAANHIINIAFHALNAWLVFALASRAVGLSFVAAVFAALVFALLPMQTESVAWITGRVDSMPACFYLASFLAFVRWRDDGRSRDYAWSLAWCFVALFSKQNTVTLGPALVAFDWLVRHRPLQVSWTWVRPYVPFAFLTAGYLYLRYVLFGEVARESMLTEEHFKVFASDLVVHLQRLVYGEAGVAMASARLGLIVMCAGTCTAVLAMLLLGRSAKPLGRVALYFGVVWLGLSVAPTIVAGYASPRHMYLASVAWAVLVAIPVETAWRQPRLVVRLVTSVVAVALLIAYTNLLARDVSGWETRSAVAERIVRDIEREVQGLPAGSLVIVGAPRRSFDFAIPHALRPPFTDVDMPAHVKFVSHSSLHCCPATVWEPHTRNALRAWLDDAARPPVVALHWHPETGVLSRVDDGSEPFLRNLVAVLLETRDVASLDSGLLDVLNKLVAGRATKVSTD